MGDGTLVFANPLEPAARNSPAGGPRPWMQVLFAMVQDFVSCELRLGSGFLEVPDLAGLPSPTACPIYPWLGEELKRADRFGANPGGVAGPDDLKYVPEANWIFLVCPTPPFPFRHQKQTLGVCLACQR